MIASKAVSLTQMRSPDPIRNFYLFLCLILSATSVAIWWKPSLATVFLAWQTPEYTHVFVIIPISLYLAFRQRDAWARSPKLDPPPAIPLLLLSLPVGLWSSRISFNAPDFRLFVCMLALVTWWFGAIALCFGRRVFRIILFPLLFLFWVVPWPEIVVSRVVAGLQQASASLAHFMFLLSGVPASKDGVVLSIPGLSIEVASECSSIRSSMILVITSMVLTHVLLRSTWRRWLVILLTLPLSVAKNAMRIFTLSMLATHVDPSFLTGRLHRQGGIVFFSLSVVALWFLILVLKKSESASRKSLDGSAAAYRPLIS
jgi:exosortase